MGDFSGVSRAFSFRMTEFNTGLKMAEQAEGLTKTHLES